MNKKGLTFVEVIVSVTIITLIVATMFTAFVGSRYVFNRARHRMQAFNYAREVLDRLRANYGYDGTQMAVGTHQATETGISVSGDMQDLIADGSFTYDVTTPNPTAYKKVVVNVTWDERTTP